MPAGVRIAVENDESKLSAEYDQVLGAVELLDGFTEDTSRATFIAVEVFLAPGGVDMIHACYFILKSGQFWNFDLLTAPV